MSATRYMRLARPVEAHRFDGSEPSAQAIAAAFPYRVARSVGARADLLVLCGAVGRLVRVLEGTWVVEDQVSRALELFTEEEFERTHGAEAA